MTTLAAAALVFQAGCTSGGGRKAQAPGAVPPEGAVREAEVRVPAEIQSLELKAGSGSESVELSADRPLVWTSFRDAAGDLVIELPNSIPTASVASLVGGRGLVEAVDVKLIEDASTLR